MKTLHIVFMVVFGALSFATIATSTTLHAPDEVSMQGQSTPASPRL